MGLCAKFNDIHRQECSKEHAAHLFNQANTLKCNQQTGSDPYISMLMPCNCGSRLHQKPFEIDQPTNQPTIWLLLHLPLTFGLQGENITKYSIKA